MDGYEVRWEPDGFGWFFRSLARARRWAEHRARRTGAGPYLLYRVSDAGESFVGEVG